MLGNIDEKWLEGKVWKALTAAANRDSHDTASILYEVGLRYGGHGLWLFCCGIASAAASAKGVGSPSEGGMIAVRFVYNGKQAVPESVPEARHELWAVRLIAAVVNRDAEQARALWDASIEGEQVWFYDDMSALMDLAGSAIRDAAGVDR
jgi:hypothetical protein